MKRIFVIAMREFMATVTSRAFIIGLLIVPVMIGLLAVLAPRLFNPQNFRIRGELAVIDPTGVVAPELRKAFDPQRIAARQQADRRQALTQVPGAVRELAASAPLSVPDVQIIDRPSGADVQQEKSWLNAEQKQAKHLALVLIHSDAVTPEAGNSGYGSYDFFVPSNSDDRAENAIRQGLQEAIVNARIRARNLDGASIEAMVRVPRVPSIAVTKDNERQGVGAFNILLPFGFAVLLFIGVISGGQSLLTSTVEEKSSRVIEVILSAVSPRELMAGKLLGQMAVSLLAMSIYIAMGLAMLTSFSLFGLLNVSLIFYLVIFFLLTYFVFGSLLMAIGSAVNDMREAQGLMMPIIILLVIPYVLAMPISRDPNTVFATAMSFIPPINGFAMLIRMASLTPPPLWQVWLSIAIGIGSAFAAIAFTAKVFRIGLLMYGKPPDFATLIRWVRAA